MKPTLFTSVFALFTFGLFNAGLTAQNLPLFQANTDPVCTPMQVSISNVLPDAAAYHWDFGNGLTFNNAEPGVITFQEPGQYTITLTATPGNGQRLLQQIQILSIPGNWWEIFDNVPDLYAIVYDAEGQVKFRSNTITQNPASGPVNLTVFGLLSDEQYQIKVWDYDALASNDYLGFVWIDGGLGSATVTEGDLSLSYASEMPSGSYTHSVTVQVGQPAIEQSGDFLVVDLNALGISPEGILFQWYLDGQLISGENTFSIIPPAFGTYTAKLYSSSCVLETAPYEYAMVGTYAAEGATPITIYPNPAPEQVFLSGDIPAGTQLSLYNASGGLLRQSRIDKGKGDFALSLEAIPAGLYFLRISSIDGELLYSSELVKQ